MARHLGTENGKKSPNYIKSELYSFQPEPFTARISFKNAVSTLVIPVNMRKMFNNQNPFLEMLAAIGDKEEVEQ